MSIDIAAARSRDQINQEIILAHKNRRLPSQPPVESLTASIPSMNRTTLQDSQQALPTQSQALPTQQSALSSDVRHLLSLTRDALGRLLLGLSGILHNHDMICAPCWIHNRESAHELKKCRDIGVGYLTSGSTHKAWKGRFNLPKGQCYRCCFPQVSVYYSVTRYQVHNILRIFFRLKASMRTMFQENHAEELTSLGQWHFRYGTLVR